MYEYINIIGFDLELLRKKRGWEVWKNAKKEKHRKKKEKRKRKKMSKPSLFVFYYDKNGNELGENEENKKKYKVFMATKKKDTTNKEGKRREGQ